MKNNNRTTLKLYLIVLFIIGFISTIFFTNKLYQFINPNDKNMLSKNMLIAIKNYDVTFEIMFKKKILYRVLELILLSVILLTKYKNKFVSLIIILIGVINGFFCTIFYLEMGNIGIINYILSSFPHKLFYLASILSLIWIVYDKTPIYSKSSFCNKASPYIHIVLLWFCGILSETVINLFLVQKFFIIA